MIFRITGLVGTHALSRSGLQLLCTFRLFLKIIYVDYLTIVLFRSRYLSSARNVSTEDRTIYIVVSRNSSMIATCSSMVSRFFAVSSLGRQGYGGALVPKFRVV